VPYHDYTPGYKPSTMKDFIDAIYGAFTGEDKYRNARVYVNKRCNAYQQNNRREFVSLLHKMGILSPLTR